MITVSRSAIIAAENSNQFPVFSFEFAVQSSHLIIDVTQTVASELKTENSKLPSPLCSGFIPKRTCLTLSQCVL